MAFKMGEPTTWWNDDQSPCTEPWNLKSYGISTIFFFDFWPETILTWDGFTMKWLDSRFTISALALPRSGGDFIEIVILFPSTKRFPSGLNLTIT